MAQYSAIYPGKMWLDTSGKPIQAHGGSMLYEDGTFYWYGENKEKTTGRSKLWHWGVRCYTSTDLYNWDDKGLIIPPDTQDETSPLHPNQYLDRPHIIYNEKTKKYVCYLKFSGMKAKHFFAVLCADNVLGPYTIVKKEFMPLDRDVGDFDLFKATDGTAYLYFESEHKRLICVALSEDYLDTKQDYTVYFEGLQPPYTREAPAHFEHGGKHYLVTSGMTGYVPNPSEMAVADHWNGPFTVQGNAHPGDTSCSSYNSQISCVFQHPHKKDLYIAMADRWVPDYPVTRSHYEAFARVTNRFSGNKKMKVSLRDLLITARAPFIKGVNTSISTYVWLPVRFDGERAYINWEDEWRVEDF